MTANALKVEFPADIFDAETNIPLIHQVVVAQQAAARQGTHATKTRGEVRGGGRKPYKQKGTGRARQGSTRAPQFAGGGTVHGPQPRSYDQRTPKKMKAAALRGALSDRARAGRIHVVDGLVSGDKPSTRLAVAGLNAISQGRRQLVVLERDDALTWLSLRNVASVHLLAVDQLNTYDVLLSDDVVFTKGAYETLVPGGTEDAEAVELQLTVKRTTKTAEKLGTKRARTSVSRSQPAQSEPADSEPAPVIETDKEHEAEPEQANLQAVYEAVMRKGNVKAYLRTDDTIEGTSYELPGLDPVAVERHGEFVLASWPSRLGAEQALDILLDVAEATANDESTFYADTSEDSLEFEDGAHIPRGELQSRVAELWQLRLELDDETLIWRQPVGTDEHSPRFVVMERILDSTRIDELVSLTGADRVDEVLHSVFGDHRWNLRPLLA